MCAIALLRPDARDLVWHEHLSGYPRREAAADARESVYIFVTDSQIQVSNELLRLHGATRAIDRVV
jgi:hypothetical protein